MGKTSDELIVKRLTAYLKKLNKELEDRSFYSGDPNPHRTQYMMETVEQLEQILK